MYADLPRDPTVPLDRAFNVAVNHMAARVCPTGFDVTMDASAAPDTLGQLRRHIERTGRILVWGGASDTTIYACRETNAAFRAWHDWTHYILRAPFDLPGERTVCARQQADLALIYAGHDRLPLWQRLLEIEIVGQAVHLTATGSFLADQRGFAHRMLERGTAF